jgi:hypothetical protein
VNGLRVVRGITIEDRTAVGIYRGERLVTMAIARNGELSPGFAKGFDLSAEEACWAIAEASRLFEPASWPLWKYLAATVLSVFVIVPIVAVLFGMAIKWVFLR